jgi:hypothetical protein
VVVGQVEISTLIIFGHRPYQHERDARAHIEAE